MKKKTAKKPKKAPKKAVKLNKAWQPDRLDCYLLGILTGVMVYVILLSVIFK